MSMTRDEVHRARNELFDIYGGCLVCGHRHGDKWLEKNSLVWFGTVAFDLGFMKQQLGCNIALEETLSVWFRLVPDVYLETAVAVTNRVLIKFGHENEKFNHELALRFVIALHRGLWCHVEPTVNSPE